MIFHLFNHKGKQLKLAYRSLLNAPGFLAATLITLSLTLASLFVVVSIVNTYFLKPMPVMDEKRLTVIEQETVFGSGSAMGFQSFQSIIHWYKNSNSFEKSAIMNSGQHIFTSIKGEPRVNVIFSTFEYFNILKVPFVLGQGFSSQLGLEEVDDSIVVSESFWRRHLDADINILGKVIKENADENKQYKVIGVVSDKFNAPFMINKGQADIWLPLSSDRRYFNENESNPWWNTFKYLKLFGITKQGINEIDVTNELSQLINNIKAQWLAEPDDVSAVNPIVTSYRKIELGENDRLSLLMLAGSLGLLLIALVNVSNLFFSRALAKHKTLILQVVLGAKRRTIFNAILAETMLIVLMSVGFGLFLAAWGIKLFKALAEGHLPLVESVNIDMNVVLVAIFLCIALAYLFAFITSRLINFSQLSASLQSSGKGSVNQVSGRTVKFLVTVQMALASSLVIFSSMILTKTLDTLNRPLGSEIHNLYSIPAGIPGNEASLAEKTDQYFTVKNAFLNLPEVEDVALGWSPVRARENSQTLTNAQGKQSAFIPGAWVGDNYFNITGLKIIAGRGLSDAALRGEINEMLVSKSAATFLQADGKIIGQTFIGLRDESFEVVGITEDFNNPKFADHNQGRHLWWPMPAHGFTLILKLKEGNTLTKEQVYATYKSEFPRTSMWEMTSFEETYNELLYMDHLTLAISSILALFTLVLAGVGIYGVLSYNLGLRRYEFGIRMALGAKKHRLYKLMAKEAFLPLVLGLFVAVILTSIFYSIYGERLENWLALNMSLSLVAILFTVLVALIASFTPMRKLITGKPLAALRNE